MKTVRAAWLVSDDWRTFRPSQPARIIGVVLVTPEGGEERACYHVEYPDGVQDWTPIHGNPGFRFVHGPVNE